jgi:hypothetical protein
MAIFLAEDVFGADDNVIGFPHLLLCLGFVVIVRRNGQDDGELWGMHMGNPESSQPSFAVFASYLRKTAGVKPKQMVAIYGCCDRRIRYGGVTDPEESWRNEMRGFAKQLGFRGLARGFDTNIIGPKDGTYVEYHAVRPALDRCRIFYKRNEKMEYSYGTNSLQMVFHPMSSIENWKKLPKDVRKKPEVKAKFMFRVGLSESGCIDAQPGLKDDGLQRRHLKEVDYATRLDEFRVK